MAKKTKYIIELVNGTKIPISSNRKDFENLLEEILVKFQTYPNVYINLGLENITDENIYIKGNSVVAIYEDKEREIINE